MPKWFLSPIFAICITLLSILLLLSLLRTDVQLEEAAGIRDELRNEVEGLRDEVAHIQKETQLATSAASQEKVIRNELLMQKPGEYVVQLPSMESIDRARTLALENKAIDTKNHSKMLDPQKSAFQNWFILFGR